MTLVYSYTQDNHKSRKRCCEAPDHAMEQNQCQNLKLLFSWIVWGRISVKILFCMVFFAFFMIFSHGLFARSFLMVFSIVFADFSWSLYGIWSLATPIRQGRPFITLP